MATWDDYEKGRLERLQKRLVTTTEASNSASQDDDHPRAGCHDCGWQSHGSDAKKESDEHRAATKHATWSIV